MAKKFRWTADVKSVCKVRLENNKSCYSCQYYGQCDKAKDYNPFKETDDMYNKARQIVKGATI